MESVSIRVTYTPCKQMVQGRSGRDRRSVRWMGGFGSTWGPSAVVGRASRGGGGGGGDVCTADPSQLATIRRRHSVFAALRSGETGKTAQPGNDASDQVESPGPIAFFDLTSESIRSVKSTRS